MPPPPPTVDAIVTRARAQGFALAGVAPAAPSDYADHFRRWLDAHMHGEMHYLAEHFALRTDPREMVPGAQAVICVADFYPATPGNAPASAGPAPPADQPKGRIARYAWGNDYHKIIKKRLHALADDLAATWPDHTYRAAVDTAPVFEREHARRAGMGWVGKHTLLIHPLLGSWMLLGQIITTLRIGTSESASGPLSPGERAGVRAGSGPLSPWERVRVRAGQQETSDNTSGLQESPAGTSAESTNQASHPHHLPTPRPRPGPRPREEGGPPTDLSNLPRPNVLTTGQDHCGTCTRCIDACPTHCITPYQVDASRCISYLTIEHRDAIDPALHAPMGDWIAGCDVCQEVCPYNNPTPGSPRDAAQPPPTRDDYHTRPPGPAADLLDILNWTPQQRHRILTRSPLKRIKYEMWLRNALIAAGNYLLKHDHPALLAAVRQHARDPHADPVVRDTARHTLTRMAAHASAPTQRPPSSS